MANIQEKGIKLFGKKITLHDEQEDKSNENSKLEKGSERIIPCPRCKSLETKFCYFNNYNVNQPRHFCRACQRYWTAGGALRNVPVGAGRRKTKPPSLTGFPHGCMYDGSDEVHRFIKLDGLVVVDEWHITPHGGSRHVFPVKRRKGDSGCQTC